MTLVTGDDIHIVSPLDVVAKEVKQDDRLCRQVYYTLLSTYTDDPVNLAINAPAGEGKSYVVKKVAELFPKSDVLFLSAMSDKALFHRPGVLVIKNENGEYQSIEDKVAEIDSEIEDKQSEIGTTNDPNTKQGLRSYIKSLQDKKKELTKDAMKLIDLNHKALIFLDTPNHTLLEAIMSLLSHDHHEVEYHFVDNFNGIRTKTNVLRGFPTVIFTAAIDYSKYQRYSEIQRRFIVTNPKMTAQKYKESIELIGAKNGLPDFVYDATVVSESEKNQAREIIKELKEKIKHVSERNNFGSPNVFIPFRESVEKSLPTEQASDMTTAQRLYNYMKLLALVNIDQRPRLVTRSEGNSIMKTCPFATFEDLQESVYLMEYSNGVRPYVLEWFNEIFLVEFNDKRDIDNNDGNVIGITTKDLVDATFRIKGRKFSTQQIYENYVLPLVNAGYIDKVENKKDKRSYLFYPVLNGKQKKLFDLTETNNFSQQKTINVVDYTTFPDRNYLISKIKGVLKYSFEKHKITKLENHEGREITVEELADQYYKDPDKYFEANGENATPPSSSDGGAARAITVSVTSIQPLEIKKDEVSDEYSLDAKNRGKSQQNIENDVKSRQNNHDQSTKLFDEGQSNNFFIFNCYYCNYQTNTEREYERHVVLKHPGKLAYPSEIDLKKMGVGK
jgi:hypothetical protein